MLTATGLCAGEATSDVRLLDAHHLVLATPQQWDMLSRRWKQRKAVQAVGLFIADELQLLGGQQGPTLEVICSRMRYMSSQLATPVRLVGFSHRWVLAGLAGVAATTPCACTQHTHTYGTVAESYIWDGVCS
jgi:replicative superfamily II helicase